MGHRPRRRVLSHRLLLFSSSSLAALVVVSTPIDLSIFSSSLYVEWPGGACVRLNCSKAGRRSSRPSGMKSVAPPPLSESVVHSDQVPLGQRQKRMLTRTGSRGEGANLLPRPSRSAMWGSVHLVTKERSQRSSFSSTVH